MKYVITILSVVILFNSCSENNDFTPPDIQVQLLKKIIYVDHNFPINSYETIYQYDAMNRISSINKNGLSSTSHIYTYHSDTTKIHTYFDSALEYYRIEYPVNQGNTMKAEQYGHTRIKPNVHQDSITYLGHQLTFHSTNSCEKIERIESYYWDNTTLSGYKTFDYTDDNGSYISKTYGDNSNLSFITTFTKNEKAAPYNRRSEYLCFDRAASDVKIWDGNNVLEHNSSITYEYNSNNYPTSSISTDHTSGSIREYQYEYY